MVHSAQNTHTQLNEYLFAPIVNLFMFVHMVFQFQPTVETPTLSLYIIHTIFLFVKLHIFIVATSLNQSVVVLFLLFSSLSVVCVQMLISLISPLLFLVAFWKFVHFFDVWIFEEKKMKFTPAIYDWNVVRLPSLIIYMVASPPQPPSSSIFNFKCTNNGEGEKKSTLGIHQRVRVNGRDRESEKE